jgi:thermostable 8-oxoguanine DNA glycosylase
MKLRDRLNRDFRNSDENEKILSAYDKVIQNEASKNLVKCAAPDCDEKVAKSKKYCQFHQKMAKKIMGEAKKLSVPEKHQLKIAKKTLKMSDAGANIMGGMTKKEAIDFLKKIGYTDKQIKKMSEETEEQTEIRTIQNIYEKTILKHRL